MWQTATVSNLFCFEPLGANVPGVEISLYSHCLDERGLCWAGVREVCCLPKPSKQKGKQGCDCFQAIQAVLITFQRAYHSIKHGEGGKKKAEREAPNPQPGMLSKLLFGMLVTPPALGKQLSHPGGLLRRLLKPFNLKIFGISFCLSWEDTLACIWFQQRNESSIGKKPKENPTDFPHGCQKGSRKSLPCEWEGHQEVLLGSEQVKQLYFLHFHCFVFSESNTRSLRCHQAAGVKVQGVSQCIPGTSFTTFKMFCFIFFLSKLSY